MISKNDSGPYIAQFLKQHDPERYYSTLVLNETALDPVQALYAFNAEIARIRELTSEPIPGEIRLQYWTDLLSGNSHGDTAQNPIAVGLLTIIENFDLPKAPLLRLLEARRFDLYDDAMPDMPTFEGYAGETNSMLYQLAVMVVNGGKDAGAADAAGHLGVAHTLIGHLRALSNSSSRGQVFLPVAIFKAHGASQSDLLQGKNTPEIIAACASLRFIAQDHLNKTAIAIKSLPPVIRPVFAHISVLNWQLQRLNKKANTPFSEARDLPPWRKIAKVFWWSLRS